MPFVVTGRRRLRDMLDEEAPGRCARRIADAAGDRMEAHTRHFTPIATPHVGDVRGGRPPGTARASVHRTPVEPVQTVRGRGWQVWVRTEDPVFPFIEWTTRPHIITPRHDRAPATVLETGKPRGTLRDGRAALSWIGTGGRHFARVVHHPGTRGQHPFARGAHETAAQVTEVAQGPLERFGRELVRAA